MTLLAVGINHNTASLSLREKVSFTPESINQALLDACTRAGLSEIVILSTCNRTELYLSGNNDHQQILCWLADFHQLHLGELEDCHYYHHDEDAIRHMMLVASGLDSLVLGEPQILGQMKSAFAIAQDNGTLNGPLHQAFQQVFAIAKRVRSETAIGQNPVSVAYAAVRLAQRIFSNLSRSTALLIGAGKTIELVARHLREQGVRKILIANRNLHNAQQLVATLNEEGPHCAEAIALTDMPARLHEADIVISSTASQLPILGKGTVEAALRRRKRQPIFMVDIAVPRDIEPQVAELDDVYLYTVDDLRDVIDENQRAREQAAEEARAIIEQGIENYRQEKRAQEAAASIVAYRQHAESLRDIELERALKALHNGDAPEEVLRQLARNLTNKLLHQTTENLRKTGKVLNA